MSPTGYPDYPTSLLRPPRFTAFKPPSAAHRENEWFDEVVSLPCTMRAGRIKAMVMLAVLVLATTVGCLSSADDEGDASPITMNVHYDLTAGTITERVQNGAVLSQNGVELSFDFARVTSRAGSITTLTLDPGDDEDGSNAITVNANEQAEITYTYMTHGLFTVRLSATDESENMASIDVVVRIDKEIDWTDTNTNDPDSMVVATAPDCVCPTPERIDVDSTIENPNDLIASPRAEVTWHLNDPSGEEQAFHTEQIGEGQEASWTHSQYNVDAGDWMLNVTIDSGNESLNLHHVVFIAYEAVETEPNPLTIEEAERREDSLSQ